MIQDLGGQKLGQYELRERLGRGGMADVYKAFQPGLERFVAIKVMLGHLATDAEFIERFRREARAVAQLRHPNIVSVFDFGIERDIYYMVMEFIKGENLKAYIARHPKGLPLEAALRIASQLADALDYAHKAGMIHRDVKPANIMFTDDTYQQAILTDFGIAHILSQPGLTASGAMVGTPAYLSPEIASGHAVDKRADIYGLGIILYEMLTGRVPYEADTPVAIIMKHVNAPVPSPAEFGRELPESVEAIVLKAMMKNPDDRYQTAAEMKAAIDSARASLPKAPAAVMDQTERATIKVPEARPPQPVQEPPVTRVHPTTARSLLPGIGLGAVAVLAVLAALVLLSRPPDASDQPAALTATALTWQAVQVAQEATAALALTEARPTETSTATSTAAPTWTPAASVTPTRKPSATPVPTELPARFVELREAGMLSGLTPLQDEIDALILDGQADVARERLNRMLAADPDNLDARVARALLLAIVADDGAEAMADADRAVELAPDSPLGYIARSEAFQHWSINDDQASLDAAQQALAIAPDNPEALWRASSAQADLGNYEAFSELFNQAEAAGAVGFRFVNFAADYLFYAEDYQRALPYMQLRYSASAGDEYALRMLVADLLHLDQAEAAYQTVQDFPLVFTEPDDLSAAAFVAFKAGDYAQARDWADTARALSNEAYAATYLLGLLSWYVDKDLDAAMDYFDQLEGVEFYDDFLNPAFGHQLHMDRGYILMQAGEYEAASSAFERALETLGQYPYVYEALADARLALGDVEGGRQNLQLALDNTYENRDEQRRLLQRIRDLGAAGRAATATAEPTEAGT